MATYFGTTDEQTSALFVLVQNSAAGAANLASTQGMSQVAVANALLNASGLTTIAGLVALVQANLGIPATDTGATKTLTGFFGTTQASAAQGLVNLVSAVIAVASPTNDLYKSYGTYANNFITTLEAGYAWSKIATNNSTDTAVLKAAIATSTAGTTFTLTTGSNVASGTYIDGSRFLSGGTFLDTLNSSDTITGTSGTTDTLFVQAAAAGTTTPVSISAIEILTIENLTVVGGAYTLSLANGDALLKTINVNNSTIAGNTVTVTNNNAALTTLSLSNNSVAVSVASIATAVVGTTDTLAINVSSAVAGTTITFEGYETVNLTSNGTVANAIGAITDASLTTLNIFGAQQVTLSSANTNLVTVNAATATGKVLFTTSAVSNIAITGGTAADTFTMTGTYTTADTINGGTGTDTLVLNTAELTGATTVQSNVSSIEVLTAADSLNGLVTLANFGATGFKYALASANANTITYAAGTGTLDLGAFAQTTGLILNSTGVATTDALTMTLGSSTIASGANTLVTSNGFETINLVSQGGANSFTGVFTMTNTAATETLTITGSQSLTITGVVTADAINASGMTGTAALTLTGGAGVNSATITGTANADTLIGGAAADIISGGAGNDTIGTRISGTAAAADVLTGGAGQDTFTLIGSLAAAADYTAVARVSDFTYSATSTATDIISLSATLTNYVAGAGTFVAGIAAAAPGATAIQTVGQNAATAAYVTGVDLIKLTTGVAALATVQLTFDSAIGTGVVNTVGGGRDVFVAFYDTTNSRAVFASANTAAGVAASLEAADVITVIGSVDMSAADYASFSSAQLRIVA